MNTFKNEPTKTPVRFSDYGGWSDFSDSPAPLRIIVTGKKSTPVFSAKPEVPVPGTPGQPKPDNPKPVTHEDEPAKGDFAQPGDKPHAPADRPIRPVQKNMGIENAPRKTEEEDEDDDNYLEEEEGDEYELNENDDEKEFDEREDTAF